jgi:hypothetical protein
MLRQKETHGPIFPTNARPHPDETCVCVRVKISVESRTEQLAHTQNIFFFPPVCVYVSRFHSFTHSLSHSYTRTHSHKQTTTHAHTHTAAEGRAAQLANRGKLLPKPKSEELRKEGGGAADADAATPATPAETRCVLL